MDSKEVIDHRNFVNSVTSDATVNSEAFLDRLVVFQDGDMIWSEPQRLLTGSIGICSEGGELLDLVKKLLFQGKEPTPEMREKIKLELGDVMWYVQQILLAMNWELHEVLAENTKKLSGRYPEGFSVEKSENRSD